MKNWIAKLLGVGRTLWSFILPLLASATATALETLLPIALETVASLATSEASGEEKRRVATERLKAAAIQAGVAASTSTINLAVELAVAKLREGAQ